MLAPAPAAGLVAASSTTGSRMLPRTRPTRPPARAVRKHQAATAARASACRRLNMPMADRLRRVNEAVRQVVSDALPELKDPRVGFVTVTGAETTPDLRHSRVFVSVLGTERRREQSLAALQAAHSFLQARLARELRLKRTPQLTFEYDPSVERGVRLGQLIDELAPDE